VNTIDSNLQNFIDFASTLQKKERKEAQLFCDRLFQAFGHNGLIESKGSFETRIQASNGHNKYIDCVWVPPNHPGVLIEMKSKSKHNLEIYILVLKDLNISFYAILIDLLFIVILYVWILYIYCN
jgi:hypothetical protein